MVTIINNNKNYKKRRSVFFELDGGSEGGGEDGHGEVFNLG